MIVSPWSWRHHALQIWDAINRYAVVVFSNQHLTDAPLHDFAAQFGDLEIGRSALRPGYRRLAIPQIGDISNLDEDNNVRALDDRLRLDGLANRLWHTEARAPVAPTLREAKPLDIVTNIIHPRPIGPVAPGFLLTLSPARVDMTAQRRLRRGIRQMENKMTESDKLGLINATASDERSAVPPSGGLINRTANVERNAVPSSRGLINNAPSSRQD